MNRKTPCAFARDNRCTALTDKFCKGCSFFKTEEEVKKSRKRTEKRISSLPMKVQTAIRTKYFTKKVILNEQRWKI